MKVALVNVDGFKYPNLALMKLSAIHKRSGDTVEWYNGSGKYDIIYKSKVFTYTKEKPVRKPANKVIKGGTGYDLSVSLPYAIEHIYPDYSIYNEKKAYGFLTRGCPKKCSWCIVPHKEGKIIANTDIEEFWNGQQVAILMDNNVLAHQHGLDQIEKIAKLGIKVDFNQGLDADLIVKDESLAERLGQLKWYKPLRLACDTNARMETVKRAVELLRKHNANPKNYFVYMLVKDIDEAYERAIFLRELKLDPFAQPYIDFRNNVKPTREQRRFARWVNLKQLLRTVDYYEYIKTYKTY